MVKIFTLFQTKTAQKTIPFGAAHNYPGVGGRGNAVVRELYACLSRTRFFCCFFVVFFVCLFLLEVVYLSKHKIFTDKAIGLFTLFQKVASLNRLNEALMCFITLPVNYNLRPWQALRPLHTES